MFKTSLLPRLSLFALLLAAILPFRLAPLVDTWLGLIPLLFIFAGFALALWGWGRFFAVRLGYKGAAEAALFSSLAAVVPAFLLGHLGFLTTAGTYAAFAFLILGIFLRPPVFPLPRLHWELLIAFFVVVFRFFCSYVPASHGDPFIYHLLGPRLWVEQGSVKVNPELPNALLASAWEYFYVWPQLLFARVGEIHSLVLAQIFSQWIHLLWGWLGIPLVADALFFPSGGKREQRFLLFFSLLFVSSLQWTGSLAKNDCGVAFWALGAFLFWTRGLAKEHFSFRDFLLAGVFGGLAVAGKLNAAIFLAPAFFVSFCFTLRGGIPLSKLAAPLVAAVATAIAAGIFFLRNYLLTFNPFFPMFQSHFHSPWVSQSWADNFASMHPNESLFHFAELWERIKSLPKENPLLLGWLLLLGFFFFPKGRIFLARYAAWLAVALITFLFFGLGFGGNIELRHLGAGLILLTAIGTLAVWYLLDCFANPYVMKIGFRLLVVVLLACSHLPLHLLGKALKIHPGVPFLATHTAGDSKAWLRENASSADLIVAMADNEMYYLSAMRVTVMSERPDIDAATNGEKDFKKFMRGLCHASQGKYLLDARANIGLTKRFPKIDFSSALLYRGDASAVYDLGKMEKLAYREAPDCASASR